MAQLCVLLMPQTVDSDYSQLCAGHITAAALDFIFTSPASAVGIDPLAGTSSTLGHDEREKLWMPTFKVSAPNPQIKVPPYTR